MADDGYGRDWIMSHATGILEEYSGTPMTIRQLYYRLVAAGMPNNIRAYKRVDSAMTEARWKGEVAFDAFVDRERTMPFGTDAREKDVDDEIAAAERQVRAWMTNYRLEKWSNQDNYVEVWIEKKALQGVFERPCMNADVGLAPCKGYPSLTFLADAADRFKAQQENGKHVVLIYFGDHDPSGDDIPRSLKENLARMGADVDVPRIALTGEQVTEMGLPHAPVKETDSRSANWDGEGAVELDAVEPRTLVEMVETAIAGYFDEDRYEELQKRETRERRTYQKALKDYVNGIKDTDEPEDDDEDA